MDYTVETKLHGTIALLNNNDFRKFPDKGKNLYKFVWVRSGSIIAEIDHIQIKLEKDELIPLTPLHHIDFIETSGEYTILLFNKNFYCIYGNDTEVSCNGLLFNGSSDIHKLTITEKHSSCLSSIIDSLIKEYEIQDDLSEEMMRLLLKQFIIICTRIARRKISTGNINYKVLDIIRRFYILVDENFKEKKQVKDYADMLNRSPKTLSNLFSKYNIPSPLKIIHERIEAESKRLLLYTDKNATEIAYLLGFEDIASFSRFFKITSGESISNYRKKEKRE